jgi:hypothetical protein
VLNTEPAGVSLALTGRWPGQERPLVLAWLSEPGF